MLIASTASAESHLAKARTATTVLSDLTPYAGPFDYAAAAHLLRRTIYGPRKDEITDAVNLGLAGTVAQLLTTPALPAPPINHNFPDDPNVPIGSTWINAPFVDGVDVGMYRWPSIRGWLIGTMEDCGFSLREKMLLFWINHFGMSDVGDHRAQYQYITLMRQSALGNFRQLVKDMTIEPGMLVFLNGNQNTAAAPNENYARELLELFTLGKGPQVAPGDYTNYTEDDIIQIARILTGWRTSGMWSQTLGEPVESYFQANRHDEGEKQLSHRLDNMTFTNEGENEYLTLIDHIFTKPAVAEYICRKLYRYFVYYEIDATVEQTIIQPLAQLFIASNYEVAPVLSTLLQSQHFFDTANRGPMIKHPYDFMLAILRPLGYEHLDLTTEQKVSLYSSYYWWGTQMEMDFLYPPSVAGWKAYYQEPQYYRTWTNGATLQQRTRFANSAGWSGIWSNGTPYPFDWLGFIATLDDPLDPNTLIAEIVAIFMPQPLHQDQLDALKDTLIPGLPDFEWTVEYSDYLANPFDEMLQQSVENKVKAVFRSMFKMAEFHLS